MLRDLVRQKMETAMKEYADKPLIDMFVELSDALEACQHHESPEDVLIALEEEEILQAKLRVYVRKSLHARLNKHQR